MQTTSTTPTAQTDSADRRGYGCYRTQVYIDGKFPATTAVMRRIPNKRKYIIALVRNCIKSKESRANHEGQKPRRQIFQEFLPKPLTDEELNQIYLNAERKRFRVSVAFHREHEADVLKFLSDEESRTGKNIVMILQEIIFYDIEGGDYQEQIQHLRNYARWNRRKRYDRKIYGLKFNPDWGYPNTIDRLNRKSNLTEYVRFLVLNDMYKGKGLGVERPEYHNHRERATQDNRYSLSFSREKESDIIDWLDNRRWLDEYPDEWWGGRNDYTSKALGECLSYYILTLAFNDVGDKEIE